MKIKLIQATPNTGKMIADIASICYGKDKAENPDKLLRHLFELGHHSVFEHIYYTFKIEGISRACLAQLTRHRHASFTVESQRYVKYQSGINAIRILSIEESKDREYEYLKALASIERGYQGLLDMGVKAEDARMVLPNATATNVYMSCNLRELIHIHNVRNTKQAQWEIRDLVNEMVRLVVENSPELGFMFASKLEG